MTTFCRFLDPVDTTVLNSEKTMKNTVLLVLDQDAHQSKMSKLVKMSENG